MATTPTQKTDIVGLKELRANIETYIKRVDKGETLTVVRRSLPVFRISPVLAQGSDGERDGWETVVDFTKLSKGGVPLVEVRKALQKLL